MFSLGIIGGDGSTMIYMGSASPQSLWMVIAAAVIAYLLGNISPSILLAKAKGIDIRKEGSGNAGTTNALRVMGKKAGAITLLIDILKGVVAVLTGSLLADDIGAMWAVVAVFCGHVWPVFFGFHGGKGVATAFGALLALNPLLALSALLIVAVGVLVSKRMSVGSILGAVSFPIVSFFLERDFMILGSVLALIILIKHRANIKRLVRGEEPVMSIFEKKDKTDKNEHKEKDESKEDSEDKENQKDKKDKEEE